MTRKSWITIGPGATIFVPTEQAGRIGLGGEARMVLDAFPGLVLPALRVSEEPSEEVDVSRSPTASSQWSSTCSGSERWAGIRSSGSRT
jgi:hypothetical protein